MRGAVTWPADGAYKIPGNPSGVISFRTICIQLFIYRREKFQVAVMSSEEQILEAFNACDADKSGKISCAELAKVLKALGYEAKADEVAAVSSLYFS